MDCELSVIVPTFNEVGNVGLLASRLEAALAGISWEALFVDDDSPDGTAALVADIGRERPHVRCLKRVGRRGLSSACLEGFAATRSPFIAVMDADLQHDESLLPRMLAVLKSGEAELVSGSRYLPGGGIGEFSFARAFISRTGNRVARALLGFGLTDPMSGFFMFRREILRRCHLEGLSGAGFKILLELLAAADPAIAFRELPFVFRPRHAGESKFSPRIGWLFLRSLIQLRRRRAEA
jgi:dolichol-phosphate mannosyltransferase